jgi:hypothetical protein
MLGWTVVFGLNLIVPWSLGNEVTKGKGQIGICFGIALMWLVGCEIGRRWPSLGWNLTAGGIVVALTQFYPLIQMFAGLVAFAILGRIGSGSTPNSTFNTLTAPVPGTFLLTVTTGAVLYVVALCAGALLSLARRPKGIDLATKEKPAVAGSPTFDRELDA